MKVVRIRKRISPGTRLNSFSVNDLVGSIIRTNYLYLFAGDISDVVLIVESWLASSGDLEHKLGGRICASDARVDGTKMARCKAVSNRTVGMHDGQSVDPIISSVFR
jgi:hypothetical protein